MNGEGHPSLILADNHVIPILLYVSERGACWRSDVYGDVARGANVPGKLDMLVAAGILESHGSPEGHGSMLSLTPLGEEVVDRIMEIDRLMSSQSPKGP